MSLYSLIADLIVAVHALWVSIVVFGFVAILAGAVFGWQWIRNIWLRGIHLAMIGIVVLEAVFGMPCPLTVWEGSMRRAAGQAVNEGTFIGRCIHDTIFFDAPPWVFTCVYCCFGALVLGTMILVPPAWRKRG
jgi:hypothetical protein